MIEKQTIELSEPVQEWLSAFERLSPEEQTLAATEILKRFDNSAGSSGEEDLDMSPMSAEELTLIAARLFAMYDEEERNEPQRIPPKRTKIGLPKQLAVGRSRGRG